MSIFVDDTYHSEKGPSFRKVINCYRCKESKHMDEMIAKELKSSKGSRGGDTILICGKCHKGGKING